MDAQATFEMLRTRLAEVAAGVAAAHGCGISAIDWWVGGVRGAVGGRMG
jgi:hypothetical protein